MRIKDIFSREIDRDIKEVIKVDDRQSILGEVEEYVPTGHITEELVDALERFQSTINSPSEEINVWISGFFGSGKSSFAKVLGYLLANPEIDGKRVTDRFFEVNEIPEAKALLATIHSSAPTETVLLDLNTTPDVLNEGEPLVLPAYRTLLREFGYSTDITLAELEFEREDPKHNAGITLEVFAEKYEEVHGVAWADQRHLATAKTRASRVLHELDPANFPSADSWSNAPNVPTVSAKWFLTRAAELMVRRRPDKQRLVFVIDEVGMYVSRSKDRMRHLIGLAEECQKSKGRIWLAVTSQEKLTDVLDSIEGVQTELATAQDRFAVKVDLLPSDIDEVTGKRVLNKTAAGAKEVRSLLDANRNKLSASVALQSDRHSDFTDDHFVRLYPLVPYQLEVLIDAVSARRAQGGAPQTMGGSSRTLIKHASDLLKSRAVGLGDDEVGALVTLDRSYVLLEDVIPTAWRHEVDQVAAKHGADSLEAKIMRVVALCADVPGLALTPRNLAVVLHPSMSADPIEAQVRTALDHLVSEDRVRDTDDGYRLQSPEQKDWEKTRRGIEMKPGDAVRLRKGILKDALSSMTVTKGRTFKVELFAEHEKMSDGDITLDLREDADIDGLRRTSRSEDAKNRILWAYTTADDTWEALTELHRSAEMIDRYDNASQTDALRVLLAEERKRRDRGARAAEQLLARDITSGTTVFDGSAEDAPSGELKPAADRLVTGLLAKIYPNLETFAGTFKKAEVLQILQADTLDGLPEHFGSDGLGLFKITASGRELVTASGPIETVTAYIEARKQFGEDQNGAQLERHFGGPPYGAPVEAIQAVLAAAMRAGRIEVVSQAARITSATDRRLEQVFGNIPKFRASSFRPAEEGPITIEVRAEVSEWLAKITGEPFSLDPHDLAVAGRSTFGPIRQPCTEARSTLAGAGLTVPEVLTTMDELLGRVMSTEDELVVSTMHERAADLATGRQAVVDIAAVVEAQMGTLRAAQRAAEMADTIEGDDGAGWAKDLHELLDRARYSEDLAGIKTLTTSIQSAAAKESGDLRTTISSRVDEAIVQLRSRYPKIEDDVFADTTAPLMTLAHADGLALLRANSNAVTGAVQRVAEALDVLSTTKEVRHIRISDVWSGPITSTDDLDTALGRLREAVLAQLDEQTEVRLR
jgi:hypothetical protein